MSQDSTQLGQNVKKRVIRTALGTLAMLIVIALIIVCIYLRPSNALVDSGPLASSASSHVVSQTQYDQYCPARMTRADTGSYGDKEFQASDGNIESSTRYASFGSVYQAEVTPFNDDGSPLQSLKNDNLSDNANVKQLKGKADKGAHVIQARLLSAKSGSGTIGSVVSWASRGDLKGLSAASCIRPSLRQDFLISSTDTGTSQQLVVANPSDKATSLTVKVWGAKKSGRLSLDTGDTLSVGPHRETILNLSAAAPHQQGLLVSLSSKETPVSAVVRAVSMEGLNPQGSDFVMPAEGRHKLSMIPGLQQGDQLDLMLSGTQNADVSLSWVTDEGTVPINHALVQGNKVVSLDLGEVPEGIHSLLIESPIALIAEAKLSRTGQDGQKDYAFIGPAQENEHSAIALPDNVQGSLTVANRAGKQSFAKISAYDSSGKLLGNKTVSLPSHASEVLKPDDFGSGAILFAMQDGKDMAWSLRLSKSDLTDSNLAALSMIGPTSLEVQSSRIRANYDQGLIY